MKVAIVGAGIAGLTAAYELTKKGAAVTVFEKSDRIGGNAYTFKTRDGETPDIAVAAFGKAGYPNFYRLLDELGIETESPAASYMSFYDLDKQDGIYVPSSIRGLISQRFGLLRPDRLLNFAKIPLALSRGERMYKEGKLAGMSCRQLIDDVFGFTGENRIIILCVYGLLSSMRPDDLLAAPAEFFMHKLMVHNDILSPKALYSVRVIKNGTQAYIKALARSFHDHIRLNCGVHTIRRAKDGVERSGVTVVSDSAGAETFDKVVFACPADTALSLLESPTDAETRVLGAWRYCDGRIVVHRDHSAFPPRDLIQSYTFLYRDRDGRFETSVNGALWHEAHVSKTSDYISSQHPNFPIRPELIELDTVLRTPIFDFKSYGIQRDLPALNGVQNTYYCGSHFGFGLHEDAVTSAQSVAKAITG